VVLDVDGDGSVTRADDPYSPYWPGADAVDWVGLSLFHWGSTWPWGENAVPEPGKLVDQLTGTYDGLGGDDRGLPDFYATYGEGYDKPVAAGDRSALDAQCRRLLGAGDQAQLVAAGVRPEADRAATAAGHGRLGRARAAGRPRPAGRRLARAAHS
jgi:hypothetical protein